jgi:hypothetical protein
VDGSIEELQKAPPRGIHHHYCALAIGKLSGTMTDCRPRAEGGGNGHEIVACSDCTICVGSDAHKNGELTIQQAVDQIKETGGTLCLGAGEYVLEEAIKIKEAKSLKIKGQGWKTVIWYVPMSQSGQAAIHIEDSVGVAIEDLQINTIAPYEYGDNQTILGGNGISLEGTNIGITVQGCIIWQKKSEQGLERDGAALALEGILIQTAIRNNLMISERGISVLEINPNLTTASLFIEDNVLYCDHSAINFTKQGEGEIIHLAETRISGNSIFGCLNAGIIDTGRAYFTIDIQGNELRIFKDGIVVHSDGARIANNDIGALETKFNGAGIRLQDLDEEVICCQIIGNQIKNMGGPGIAVEAKMESAIIENNTIDSVSDAGIKVKAIDLSETVSIRGNHLLAAGQTHGIYLEKVENAKIEHNTIHGLKVKDDGKAVYGIYAEGCVSLSVLGNELVNICREGYQGDADGIYACDILKKAIIANNTVRLCPSESKFPVDSKWYALRICSSDQSVGDVDEIIGASLDSLHWMFLTAEEGSATSTPFHRNVNVYGNQLEGFGQASAAEIKTDEAEVMFCSNHCLLNSNKNACAVDIQSAKLVFSNNQAFGPTLESSPTVRLNTSTNAKHATVLGNVTSGEIYLYNTGLGDPWRDLNVIVG